MDYSRVELTNASLGSIEEPFKVERKHAKLVTPGFSTRAKHMEFTPMLRSNKPTTRITEPNYNAHTAGTRNTNGSNILASKPVLSYDEHDAGSDSMESFLTKSHIYNDNEKIYLQSTRKKNNQERT